MWLLRCSGRWLRLCNFVKLCWICHCIFDTPKPLYHQHKIMCNRMVWVSGKLTPRAWANSFKTPRQIDCSPTAESRSSSIRPPLLLVTLTLTCWSSASTEQHTAQPKPIALTEAHSAVEQKDKEHCLHVWLSIVLSLIRLPLNYVGAIQLALFLCSIDKKILLKLLGIVQTICPGRTNHRRVVSRPDLFVKATDGYALATLSDSSDLSCKCVL